MGRMKQSRTEFLVAGMREMMGQPQVPDDEARELCAKAQSGDTTAQDTLCSSFTRLAMSFSTAFAQQCKLPALDREDLFSTAMEDGIRFGILRYDTKGAVPFHNWVALCMRMRLAKAVHAERRRTALLLENLEAIVQYWYEDAVDAAALEHAEEIRDMEYLVGLALDVGALEDHEAAALVLRCQGLKQEEVAERLGVKRNTITRYIDKSVQVLRTIVEAEL